MLITTERIPRVYLRSYLIQVFNIICFSPSTFLLAVILPQSSYLKGYQLIQLFFGFWCFHWLLYHWWWWAYRIGLGEVALPSFWTALFHDNLLIPNPPMWLFLTEAILGALMGLYTFFIPHRTRDLIPTIGWLYTVYVNASICSYLNLQTPVILAIGIIIIGCCFGLAIWNTKRSGFIKQIKANSNSQNHEHSRKLNCTIS